MTCLEKPQNKVIEMTEEIEISDHILIAILENDEANLRSFLSDPNFQIIEAVYKNIYL